MMGIRLLPGDCREVLATLPCYDTGMNGGRFKPGQHWRPHGKHRDKDWLEQQYVALGRSAGEIAQELGFTDSAVIFWLRRHGIPRRSISQARELKHWAVAGAANGMFGRTGATNPNYVDGSSPERQRGYVQAIGRAFLRAVYKRDDYRCVHCNSPKKQPRWLHAHHIAPWAGNEALRFDASNAVTLCQPCHSWVHSKANKERAYLA
jgi:hypothetical protein